MYSEKVFACVVCKNLLRTPVMIVENIGNICQSCFDDEAKRQYEWHGVPNTKLDIILKTCRFLCKFETQGCDVIVEYENLKTHEEQCLYQLINCLLPEEVCQWRGRVVDLFKHFKEKHSEYVLNTPFEELSFDLNIEKITNVIKLFNRKNKIYVFRIKEAAEKSYLLHFIQEVNPESEDVAVVVEYMGEEGQYKLPIRRLPFFTPCDETNSKKISLAALKEIADSDSNLISVTIKPRKEDLKDIASEVLKQLECPICSGLMRPPISQCVTGHSLCNTCRKQQADCPTCRQKWGDTSIRNFALEGLTSSVEYPCENSQYGCTARFVGFDIAKHEEICEYRMYRCPKSNCNYIGNYPSCKNHFHVNHKTHLHVGTVCEVHLPPFTKGAVGSYQTKYFFEYGNIYKFILLRSIDSCGWGIQILNTFNHSVKYYFKITIIHPHKQREQMTKSKSCIDENASLTDQNNLICFTNENLAVFKKADHLINYRCELFEDKSVGKKRILPEFGNIVKKNRYLQ